jgi:hypothetical protein
MPSGKPAKSHSSDPALGLLDSALHDSVVILDGYRRFATIVIGTLFFPYAAARSLESAPTTREVKAPPKSRSSAIVSVVLALLIGVVLGRRRIARR